MIIATPAIQINGFDAASVPQNLLSMQAGGIGLQCPNGITMIDASLSPATVGAPIPFPGNNPSAVFIFVASITVPDLMVNVGTISPFALSIPLGFGMFFYGLTHTQITLSSVLGGHVQAAVGA